MLLELFYCLFFLVDKISMTIVGPKPECKSKDSSYYKVIFVEDFAYFIVLRGGTEPVIRAIKNQLQTNGLYSALKNIVKSFRRLTYLD